LMLYAKLFVDLVNYWKASTNRISLQIPISYYS